MKSFVTKRGEWLKRQLLTDEALIPGTPSILKRGDGTFAAKLAASRGRSTALAGLAWRIAEVTVPSAPTFDPHQPRLYEIGPIWESGELPVTETTLKLPDDRNWNEGAVYRLRLRVKDSAGRWSHWSSPLSPF